MEPASHLRLLPERAHALLAAASGSMDTPVPTCPDWSMADLVVHVALVWGWAAETVETRARAERSDPPADRTDEALRGWAAAQVARLCGALSAADPDASCWTFGPPPTVRFWFRRQALESVLHAWDAEHAVGTPAPLEPEVAADGVDEQLTVIVPRAMRIRPGTWSGETVHLHRTDGEGEWFLRLGPDGDVAFERAHAKAGVALRGSAESLWLWSTNRATADELGIERFGDEDVLARWRTGMVF